MLLTADAFGVLPPVSLLEGREVMYHFVQGFTARLAGTEVGLTEPQATFSACFGAPFMSHRPNVYAKLLAAKMRANEARCVLLNTGWSGGGAGEADRISIRDTRTLLDTALGGGFDGVETVGHPVFGLRFPTSCPGSTRRFSTLERRGRTRMPTMRPPSGCAACSAGTSRSRGSRGTESNR